MNTKILVCAHKKVDFPKEDIFLPIHVGAALSTEDFGVQRDDEGIHISTKNKNYSELSAHYWAWKNLKDYKYIGLCHYRRFFDIEYSEKEIEKLLHKADVILPAPIILPFNNLHNLNEILTREDVYILLYCLKTKYPDYYKDAEKYLVCSNRNIACNMFITSREIFEQYSEWLFPLLEETEKYVRLSGYTRLRRIYGYFSEVLLPIYLNHHNYKIHYKKLIDFPNAKYNNTLKTEIKYLLNNISYFLSKSLKNTYQQPASTVTGMKLDNLPTFE